MSRPSTAWTFEDQRRLMLSTRSFTTQGVVVLILYFVLWVPGFVANIVWLREAKRIEREIGVAPAGKGFLVGLLWVFVILPPSLLVTVMLLHVAGRSVFDAADPAIVAGAVAAVAVGGVLVLFRDSLLHWFGASLMRTLSGLLLVGGTVWLAVCWQVGWLDILRQESQAAGSVVEQGTGSDDRSAGDAESVATNLPATFDGLVPGFRIAVTSVELRPTVGSPGREEKATGMYLVVEFDATNLRRRPVYFPYQAFRVEDSSGHTYGEDLASITHEAHDGIYAVQPEEYDDWMPGVPYPNALVFDVPVDAGGFLMLSSDGEFAVDIDTMSVSRYRQSGHHDVEGAVRVGGVFVGEVGDRCSADDSVATSRGVLKPGTTVKLTTESGQSLGRAELGSGRLERSTSGVGSRSLDCVMPFFFPQVGDVSSSYTFAITGVLQATASREQLIAWGWAPSLDATGLS